MRAALKYFFARKFALVTVGCFIDELLIYSNVLLKLLDGSRNTKNHNYEVRFP